VAFSPSDLVPASQPNWGWNSVFEVTLENVIPSSLIPFGPAAVNRIVTPNTIPGYDFVVDSVIADVADTTFFFPRQAWIQAGRDLRDVRLDLQNLSATDTSVVQAGRDIRYVPQYQSGIPDRSNNGGYIRIGGPGALLVQAGRNIDLGTSEGITAGGNNFNSNLATSQSANLTIMAGVTGNITPASIGPFFTALQTAGVAQNAAAGQAAINSLFDGSNSQPGDITMYFSSIRTQGGSQIDLLVPDGNINAGLPTPAAGSNVGIYTTFGGAIRAYLSGDFNVNQSKVMTLDGGDILIYSSLGNIDAGRGARNSVTTQPPQRVAIVDKDGNPTGLFTFVPSADASGSGIRSLTFDPDGPGPLAAPPPGNIFLFAPKGFIDAGEAGVSSAGNIFVAALQVLNASNFSAAGSSTGVPVVVNPGVSASVAGASSVGASASKSAQDAALASASAPSTSTVSRDLPSFITVEVTGFGDEEQGGPR
jgi:filamentous hemagglutinin